MLYVYIGLHVKCTLFLSDFSETGIFSTDLRKPMRCEPSYSMLTDGRKDTRTQTHTHKEGLRERNKTDRQRDRRGEANSRFSKVDHTRLKLDSVLYNLQNKIILSNIQKFGTHLNKNTQLVG